MLHCAERGASPATNGGPKRLTLSKRDVEGVEPMTTLQAILLGMMLSWTPSVVLLAFLLWQDGIGLEESAG
jgi:hypothetical protein